MVIFLLFAIKEVSKKINKNKTDALTDVMLFHDLRSLVS